MKKKMDGTIKVMGKADFELRCPYLCDLGDVAVDPKTGICKFCKRTFNIVETQFTVDTEMPVKGITFPGE